ncbi:hypothetical protein B0J14DRAFT_639840 [Halenospora varia]|nr:hypothetical protein B0J14DRAFT_639840 [Halenospora varia]
MSALRTISTLKTMTTAPKLKVLISGAGIAGPVLAYWLARTRLDASITVVERSPSPRVTGQSIDIHGPAIDIVQKMKLAEAILSRHTTEEGTVMLNEKGKECVRFDAGTETFTAEYEILRADLCEIFMDATYKFPNIKYKFGDYILSLDQTEKDVNVAFANGSKETYDVVVAADGGISKTRSMILDETITKDSYNFLGQYTAFFSIPSKPTDPKLWRYTGRAKGIGLMMRPHRNPSTVGVYLIITMPAHGVRDPVVEEAMEKGTEATKKMLHQYFGNVGWEAKRILEGMDGAEDFYMARAAQVKLPKWTNGRAAVLGDAAHATYGVGTTLAIEGAYILAGELGKIESSKDVPAALERFEEVFRPLYKKDEDLPPMFPQMLCPQTALGIRVMHSVLWMVAKTKT